MAGGVKLVDDALRKRRGLRVATYAIAKDAANDSHCRIVL